MGPYIAPETARTYLQDVEPLWRAYWFHMHLMAKNLREFADGLGVISDDVFDFHVSGQKNDLARWVREVIGDAELAALLDNVRTKEEAFALAKARVKDLESAA
ncbi:MAG: hypothetical protein RLZZ324_539 [Candidatus Parcubacteria bacterium]